MNCEQCGGSCQPLVSDHNPPASEWYCGKCHKSYPMSERDRQQVNMMRAAAGGKG